MVAIDRFGNGMVTDGSLLNVAAFGGNGERDVTFEKNAASAILCESKFSLQTRVFRRTTRFSTGGPPQLFCPEHRIRKGVFPTTSSSLLHPPTKQYLHRTAHSHWSSLRHHSAQLPALCPAEIIQLVISQLAI